MSTEAANALDGTEKVSYSDGKTIAWTGKATGKGARRIIKNTYVKDGKFVHDVYLRNGTLKSYVLDPATKVEDRDGASTLGEALALHGFEQKYGDQLAGMGDDSYEDLEYTLDGLHDQVSAGKWKAEREGGGGGGASVLFQALVRFKMKKDGVDEETAKAGAKAFLAGKDQATKLALRSRGPLAAIVAEIEAEKAAKAPAVDTDALLGSF